MDFPARIGYAKAMAADWLVCNDGLSGVPSVVYPLGPVKRFQYQFLSLIHI